MKIHDKKCDVGDHEIFMNRKGIFSTLLIGTIDLRASKSLLPCLLIYDSENSLCSNNLLDECWTEFSRHVRFSLNPIFLSPRFSVSLILYFFLLLFNISRLVVNDDK